MTLRIPREYRRMVKVATDAGWTVSLNGGSHIHLRPPEGGKPIVFPASPSDGRRGFLNTRADFRRRGLDV